MLRPSHNLLALTSGNISIYTITFRWPIIKNFLSYFTSCATYSRNRLNGGLVTTMSDCSSNFIHSSLRKSPSPSRGCHSLFLLALSCSAMSCRLNEPSPLISPTSLMTNLLAVIFGRPFSGFSVLSSPNKPSCVLATGDGL